MHGSLAFAAARETSWISPWHFLWARETWLASRESFLEDNLSFFSHRMKEGEVNPSSASAARLRLQSDFVLHNSTAFWSFKPKLL